MSEVSFSNNIDDGGYVGPHELHVTVHPETTDPELFSQACKDLGVKAHKIYNETPHGELTIDYLTGSEFYGRSSQVFAEMGRIAAGLGSSGLHVVRQKVETTPWHPMTPKTSLDRLDTGQYFECHFTLPDLPTIHGFKFMNWGNVPFLISTTDNKKKAGLVFATMRHYISTAGEFCDNVEKIHEALTWQIGEVAMPTVEFSLYDSNPDHDKDWIDGYRNL